MNSGHSGPLDGRGGRETRQQSSPLTGDSIFNVAGMGASPDKILISLLPVDDENCFATIDWEGGRGYNKDNSDPGIHQRATLQLSASD